MQQPDAPSPSGVPGAARPATVAVIGGGPAGLMAAQVARAHGCSVDLFEAQGSVGRKVLIAGKGGLNLTHSEPLPAFLARFGARAGNVAEWLQGFGPEAVRGWAKRLGVDTFVGSSGRVFPSDLRAAPLLRGWVRRLREDGVRFHVHHRWRGWDEDDGLRFAVRSGTRPQGHRTGADPLAVADHETVFHADATVLALGGASWPQLGSDGTWPPLLHARGVEVAPLLPSNCGFEVPWSAHFAVRHAGSPLKQVHASVEHGASHTGAIRGEMMVTANGVEGSLVYALSAALREQLLANGHARLQLDLAPDRSEQRLREELSAPRNRRSIGEHLRRRTGLDPVKVALVFEQLDAASRNDPAALAHTIKHVHLRLTAMRPIAEAISSAGGIVLEELDQRLMLRKLPGVFCAGEMLDWDAPTGGYLLTACLASGHHAGRGVVDWLAPLPAARATRP